VQKSIWVGIAGLVAAVVLSGCATGSGAHDKEEIAAVLNTWKAGFEAGDVNAIMAPVSDAFTHYQWTTKAALRSLVSDALAQGELGNAKIDVSNAEYTKNDDGTWTVYPLDLQAIFGQATIEGTFKREESGWKIIRIDLEGI
jgi:hypothetical protein